ncbi:hypothetical protein [Streptomyces catenulae]|uniref:MarR family transcriptional regulator n=1 Tax=Streptomyces catenulae TaxID=66875 RepID=A0ABV2Z3Z4_9ACTN|nr:hypothetical protein [Streptomyces catenulae]
MTDNTLLSRLDAKESGARSRLDQLRTELAQLEELLANLAITRRTVKKLLIDDASAIKHPGAGQQHSAQQTKEGPPDTTGTRDHEDASRLHSVSSEQQPEETDLPKSGPRPLGPVSAKIRVLVLSADRPMTAKDVTQALGRDSEKRTNVESVRAALGKLTANGHLVKVGPGLFSGRHESRKGAA